MGWVTTLLDVLGLAAVVAGAYLLAGVGVAVVAAGVAALVVSWRLASSSRPRPTAAPAGHEGRSPQ